MVLLNQHNQRPAPLLKEPDDPKYGEGKHVNYWFDPFKGPEKLVLDGKTEQQFKANYVKVESQSDGTSLITVR